MAPPRPYWKGHMRLSLVTFAVRLYPAISTAARISFNQIDRATGQRIRERRIREDSGEEVGREDIARGYEYEKGRYVVVEDEDIEKIKLETKRAIELIQFFDQSELDPMYVDKPYYVAPDGPVAEEAFAVVRAALQRTGKMGLGRVVLAGRERLVGIACKDKGFAMFTLHPYEAIRKPSAIFEDVRTPEVDEDEVAVAEQLIARKTAPFDPTQFIDRYQEALRELIREKLAGEEPAVVAPEPERGKVVNLMDALRRSLEEQGREETPPGKETQKKKARTTRRKAAK